MFKKTIDSFIIHHKLVNGRKRTQYLSPLPISTGVKQQQLGDRNLSIKNRVWCDYLVILGYDEHF